MPSSDDHDGAPGPGTSSASPSAGRRPEQLLLAFLGEFVIDRDLGPVPTALLVDVVAELGVTEGATRAALARMARRGLLAPVRTGRTVGYLLTPASEAVLREARDRIFADDPFAPQGTGWTLVTFSVPERRRDLRHRVRAQLSWAGFGPLRDGLWIAPGEVDPPEPLAALAADEGVDVVAFRAVEVDGFPVGVDGAWRLDELRAHHEEFQVRWSGDVTAPLTGLTALVADWLAVLRSVPRLPSERLPADWPGAASVRLFHRLHAALAADARAELDRRLAG